MKLFLTGASGLLGHALAKAFLKMGGKSTLLHIGTHLQLADYSFIRLICRKRMLVENYYPA